MKKVLLIGLGGTGCAVVSKVQQMVRSAASGGEAKSNVMIRFLGFDTDYNQKDAPNLEVIRTSRDASVNTLLQNTPGWEDWFPYHPMLLSRNMLNGAGQIRALSRLAFYDLLRHPNNLTPLDRALNDLKAETGAQDDKLKIMIVSSFAGGTGSGIFLQMPLFLRSYIDRRYPGMEVLIRGLFALPDVFMGHTYSDIQRESMYANAYASLKELAAVNKVCLSTDPAMEQYDIRLDEVDFSSRRILAEEKKTARARAVAKKPKAGRKPYDFIFFVDNVNINRNTPKGDSSVYLDEMAKITYMQVYAPLMSATDSHEDNLIASNMITNGEAMYGSAGAAKLIYPYEDILQYFAYRTVGDVVSGQWSVIDEYYKKLSAELTAKKKKDVTIKIPPLSEVFIEQAEKYMNDRNANFSFLQDDVFDIELEEEGENAEMPATEKQVNRKDVFYDDMEDYISNSYTQDPVIITMKSKCGCAIKDKDKQDQKKVISRIKVNEISMNSFYESIDDRIAQKYLGIADSIFPEELGGLGDDPSKKYNIRNLLEKQVQDERHAIHPLAARYLLYSLNKEIVNALSEYEKSAKSAKKAIDKYWAEDQDPSTENIKDEWYDVVPKRGGARKDFIGKYTEESEKQLKRLETYGKAKMFCAVLAVVSARIGGLLKRYEKVFGTLDKVTAALKSRSQDLVRKYAADGTSEVYLCATSRYLDGLYGSLNVSNSGEGAGIYDKMFAEIFKDAMRDMARKAQNRAYTRAEENLEEQRVNTSVLEMFRSQIVPYYREELREQYSDVLDLNVYAALEAQSRFDAEAKAMEEERTDALTQEDFDNARRELLNKVYRKAAPYLYSEDYHEPIPEVGADNGISSMLLVVYWGMSNTVLQEIKDTQGENQAGSYMQSTESPEPGLDASRMYSDYELCCYRPMYGVQLTEIPKFQESDDPLLQGEFYQHYTERIRKMLRGNYGRTNDGITPHLDIRWHTRQYLPMISGAKDDNAGRNAARAMWLSFLYGNIVVVRNRGKKELVVQFMPGRRGGRGQMTSPHDPRRLLCDGQPITSMTRAYDIYRAFQQDTLTTEQALKVLDESVEQDSILDGSVNYDFCGPRAIPLAKALIGISDAEAEGVKPDGTENEEAQEYMENKRFNTNVLTIMNRIIVHQQASESDKKIIMDALWEIIEQFGEQMTDARFHELLMRIFANSPYVRETERGNARMLVLEPYFADIEAEYDKGNGPRTRKTRRGASGAGADGAAPQN